MNSHDEYDVQPLLVTTTKHKYGLPRASNLRKDLTEIERVLGYVADQNPDEHVHEDTQETQI